MAEKRNPEQIGVAEHAEHRLDSWKEIAHFLKRDVRTVQRWEKDEALPVHRHQHHNRSSVFAFEEELECWLEKDPGRFQENPRLHRFTKYWLPALSGFLTLLAVTLLLTSRETLTALQTEVDPFPKPVTGLPGHEINPSLSPTGTQVVFSWNGLNQDNDDLYIQEIAGGNPVRITTDPALDFSPSWSPKGNRIAFLRKSDKGTDAIVIIDPLSRAERTLLEVEVPPADSGPQIAWTPDGSSLVIAARWDKDKPFSLARVDPNTAATRHLTEPDTTQSGDFNPAFSPAGGLLAFVRKLGPQIDEIFLLDVDVEGGSLGNPPRPITRQGMQIRGISWVPSGEQVIFSAGSWPLATLWRVHRSGNTGAEPLVVAGLSAYDPVISPLRILLFSRLHARRNIWRINVEAQSASPYLSPSASIDLPAYSRQNDKIAYTSSQSGHPELWYQDLEESTASRLTDLAATHTGHASWSPDGNRLVFDTTADGDSEIFVLTLGAPAPQRLPIPGNHGPWIAQLTENSHEDLMPQWSQDGASVFFSSNRTGQFEVWCLQLEGAALKQVTHSGGMDPVESEDGRQLYYMKPYSTGIWRILLPNGAEEQILDKAVAGFGIAQEQLFFLETSDHGGHRQTLLAMDLESRRIEPIFIDEARYAQSMAVAPDGRSVLVSRYEDESADLMIVNGFHCRRLAGDTSAKSCPSCEAEAGLAIRAIRWLTAFSN